MNITADSFVVDIVATQPSSARIFHRHHIDFCCQGRQSLRLACRSAGAEVDQVLEDLRQNPDPAGVGQRDWKSASLVDLTKHISASYHAPLLEDLVRVNALLDKVYEAHAAEFQQLLTPLVQLVRGLSQELSFHTNEEEDRLFPAIVAIERCEAVELHGRTLDRFLERLEDEHFLAGRLLRQLSALTDGFKPPRGACSAMVALYHDLEELCATFRVHVHLENHVLFPRAAALGRARADAMDS
jgi:regulator of cell morphogenesis and NO signaling